MNRYLSSIGRRPDGPTDFRYFYIVAKSVKFPKGFRPKKSKKNSNIFAKQINMARELLGILKLTTRYYIILIFIFILSQRVAGRCRILTTCRWFSRRRRYCCNSRRTWSSATPRTCRRNVGQVSRLASVRTLSTCR